MSQNITRADFETLHALLGQAQSSPRQLSSDSRIAPVPHGHVMPPFYPLSDANHSLAPMTSSSPHPSNSGMRSFPGPNANGIDYCNPPSIAPTSFALPMPSLPAGYVPRYGRLLPPYQSPYAPSEEYSAAFFPPYLNQSNHVAPEAAPATEAARQTIDLTLDDDDAPAQSFPTTITKKCAAAAVPAGEDGKPKSKRRKTTKETSSSSPSRSSSPSGSSSPSPNSTAGTTPTDPPAPKTTKSRAAYSIKKKRDAEKKEKEKAKPKTHAQRIAEELRLQKVNAVAAAAVGRKKYAWEQQAGNRYIDNSTREKVQADYVRKMTSEDWDEEKETGWMKLIPEYQRADLERVVRECEFDSQLEERIGKVLAKRKEEGGLEGWEGEWEAEFEGEGEGQGVVKAPLLPAEVEVKVPVEAEEAAEPVVAMEAEAEEVVVGGKSQFEIDLERDLTMGVKRGYEVELEESEDSDDEADDEGGDEKEEKEVSLEEEVDLELELEREFEEALAGGEVEEKDGEAEAEQPSLYVDEESEISEEE